MAPEVPSPRVSGAALARHVFCTPQIVTGYEANGIIKREDDGLFDQDKCRGQIMAHLRNQAAGRAGNGESSLASARAELARVQREAIEWKNSVNKGDYVSADAVIRRLQNDFAVQRTLLLSWIGKLPSQVEGLSAIEIEVVLQREIYEVLDELANPENYVGRRSTDQLDEADAETANGESNTSPVTRTRRSNKTHQQPVLRE